MLFSMEVQKEESRQSIEPQFLSQAQALGVMLHIGQMNKNEHEGVIREVGRYEINLEENGKIVTLLKQEMSHLTAPHPLLTVPASSHAHGFSRRKRPGPASVPETKYPAGISR